MKLFLGITCCATAANAWDYSNVDAWHIDSTSCGESIPNQSPINIETATAGTTADPLIFQGMPDSAINPEIRHEMVINNHTWELEWDVDGAAVDPYGVVYNEKIYKLNQFHFHSPSEHTLDGSHYDLEAHMVHSCTGSDCLTVAEGDEDLVVAIFMNVGAENPYLATFWPGLANLAANSTATPYIDALANPYNGALVPPAPHDFYRYIGSTTTPSCVENVQWFLMSTPVTLSQAQLTSYRTAISTHINTQTVVSATAPTGVAEGWGVALGTNNRPIQTTGDRVPLKYTSPAETAANDNLFLWHGVLIFVGLVALALLCLVIFVFCSKPAKEKTSRAVKPVKRTKPAEEIPLVAPAAPLLVPHLFQQPMVAPMTYAQPMQMQPQMQFAQARPMMVAP